MSFVPAVRDDQGLRRGQWRVLDLIGHGNRADVLPVEYYQRPVRAAGADYLAEFLLPENIAKRGREATAVLGDDPVGAVRSASERALRTAARFSCHRRSTVAAVSTSFVR